MEKDKKEMTASKKIIINKAISFFVLLSMIIPIMCINVFADEPEPPFLNTYAANYFHGLDNNFGRNAEGTCGYVASGMLLSFYDSYWNDGFVEECYDKKGTFEFSSSGTTSSPGIERENLWRENPIYSDYDGFIDANASDHLHLRLLQIGRDDLNLCAPTLKEWIENVFIQTPIEIDWLINLYDVKDVINEYISDLPSENSAIKNNVDVKVSFFHDADYWVDENWNANIRAEMIEKITAGIPVIYFGYSETENSGHFMIGYDYDVSTDTIYFHTGWGRNTSLSDKEDGFIYTENTGILWLEIDEDNLPHQHAKNYTASTLTGIFCSCQLYECHPAHNQNHIVCGVEHDSTNHTTKCHCGASINVELHCYSNELMHTDAGHYYRCTICPSILFSLHSFGVGDSISSEQHQTVCVCGYVGEAEDHYDYSYERNTTANHKAYCECGHYMGTRFHVVPAGNAFIKFCIHCGEKINAKEEITPMPGLTSATEIIYITDAGSYIDSDGVIYLVDSDMRLYLDGELDIYELAENATGYPSV